MKKVNTTYWKQFRVGDLFDIHPTKAYKLTNKELLDGGTTPVVVNSSYNNGIGGFSTKEATEKGGMITFSDTVDAYTIFYQERDFVGYPHVQGLYPVGEFASSWSEYSLKFFATIFRIKAINNSFDYSYKFRRDIAVNLNVLLPAKDGSPDWKYMEEYMRKIELRTKKAISSFFSSKYAPRKIDTIYWKEFEIERLFSVSRPPARLATEFENGTIPFVASGNENNGVEKYVAAKNEVLDKKGCISVSPVDGSCFYQPYDFLGRGGAGSSIILLRNTKINQYSALFVCSILRNVCGKYNYSNMGSASKIKKEKILLPATPAGEPDWRYMEMYMRGVEAITKEKITILTKKKQETVQGSTINNYGTVNIYEK